jgi:hypothetical protein
LQFCLLAAMPWLADSGHAFLMPGVDPWCCMITGRSQFSMTTRFRPERKQKEFVLNVEAVEANLVFGGMSSDPMQEFIPGCAADP